MELRVLVINDDPSTRTSFVSALGDFECTVDCAASGREGLTMVGDGVYDLIYLDLNMPGLDGCSTLKGIRSIDRDVPVYMVTTFNDEYLYRLKEVVDAGVEFQVMLEPVGADKIVAITEGVLYRGF